MELHVLHAFDVILVKTIHGAGQNFDCGLLFPQLKVMTADSIPMDYRPHDVHVIWVRTPDQVPVMTTGSTHPHQKQDFEKVSPPQELSIATTVNKITGYNFKSCAACLISKELMLVHCVVQIYRTATGRSTLSSASAEMVSCLHTPSEIFKVVKFIELLDFK